MRAEDERICLNDAQFYHEDPAALSAAVRRLKQDETELRKLKGSHLEGTFTASPERVLFFSIPFDKGWTVRIDGEKVPAQRAFGTFMAVQAPSGTHTIDLRFVPVGLIPAMIVSVLSVIAAVYFSRKIKMDQN